MGLILKSVSDFFDRDINIACRNICEGLSEVTTIIQFPHKIGLVRFKSNLNMVVLNLRHLTKIQISIF